MITMELFWMGRDKKYPKELTAEILVSARETVRRANVLLVAFHTAIPTAHQRGVNSGWRPPTVNAAIKNAARKSNHMIGKAIDIGDDDGQLDDWCMTKEGKAVMADIGLWMEHPSATPRWCHVQISPPGSGNRVFYP